MALGEPKVIHGQVNARQNNRHSPVTGVVLPVAQFCVYKSIGNTFEADFAVVEHRSAVHTHVSINLVGCSRELSHTADKRLLAQIINLFIRECVAATADSTRCAYLLVDNQKVALHETVFSGEHRSNIIVELIAQQNNQHAEKIGKEETCKLWNADMLTQ